MPTIELTTPITAPVERVFDLARSIDLHTDSTSCTGERAMGGVTAGLIGPGQEVTWRARHLGIWQSLTARITDFERPSHFADVMVRGAFHRMEHHHYFEPSREGTLMRDLFTYQSPLGPLGRIADSLFLEKYMRSFLIGRNRVIQSVAESNDWSRYIVTYPNGEEIQLGDSVLLNGGQYTGVIRNLLLSRAEVANWGLNEPGVMIDTSFGGMVFYTRCAWIEDEMTLVARANA